MRFVGWSGRGEGHGGEVEEAGVLLSVEEVSVRVRLAVEISREKMKSEMVIATL